MYTGAFCLLRPAKADLTAHGSSNTQYFKLIELELELLFGAAVPLFINGFQSNFGDIVKNIHRNNIGIKI